MKGWSLHHGCIEPNEWTQWSFSHHWKWKNQALGVSSRDTTGCSQHYLWIILTENKWTWIGLRLKFCLSDYKKSWGREEQLKWHHDEVVIKIPTMLYWRQITNCIQQTCIMRTKNEKRKTLSTDGSWRDGLTYNFLILWWSKSNTHSVETPSDFELGSLPRLALCGNNSVFMLGTSHELQLPVSHAITRVNNRYTDSHSVPTQRFCFPPSVQYSVY